MAKVDVGTPTRRAASAVVIERNREARIVGRGFGQSSLRSSRDLDRTGFDTLDYAAGRG
jgi:hypothetical protein